MMNLKSSYDSMKLKAQKPHMPAPYSSDERRLATVSDQFDKLWSAAG